MNAFQYTFYKISLKEIHHPCSLYNQTASEEFPNTSPTVYSDSTYVMFPLLYSDCALRAQPQLASLAFDGARFARRQNNFYAPPTDILSLPNVTLLLCVMILMQKSSRLWYLHRILCRYIIMPQQQVLLAKPTGSWISF